MKTKWDPELNAFEEQMKVLKATFERYFLGIERLPPVRERERLTRSLRALEANPPTATAAIFRLNSLKSTWISYEAHWTRRLRGREVSGPLKSLDGAQAAPSSASLAGEKKPQAPAGSTSPLAKIHARWQEIAQKNALGSAPTLDAISKEVQARLQEAKGKHPGQKLEVKLAMVGGKPQIAVVPKS